MMLRLVHNSIPNPNTVCRGRGGGGGSREGGGDIMNVI